MAKLKTYVVIGEKIPLDAVTHQKGTLGFGHEPRTSVLGSNFKEHDLDNVYVMDLDAADRKGVTFRDHDGHVLELRENQ